MAGIRSENQKNCPSCESNNICFIDTIPSISIQLTEGSANKPFTLKSSLYRCGSCHLYFRSPQLSLEVLKELYNDEGVDYLHGLRDDWQLIATFIEERHSPEKKILDIGCFNGEFLDYFDTVNKGWQRFGIEINHDAALKAERKGIKIIGTDFNNLTELPHKFAVVTAVDIVEHSKDPKRLLKDMVSLTSPGGVVIISTGNTAALAPRIMGGDYWYYMFPGHISFINERWASNASQLLKTPIIYTKRFSHGDSDYPLRAIIDGVKNIAYKISPRGFSFLRTFRLGGIDTKEHPELKYYPPNWRSAKDHLLIAFRKQ